MIKNKTWILWAVLIGIPLTGAGTDIFVPSLPAIHEYFGAGKALIQFAIPIYIIGYGLGQIIFGPLSDSVGRKLLLIGSLVGFFIATLLVAVSPNIYILLLFRLIAGICSGVPGAIFRSVVMDTTEPENMAKKLNYITIAWALGPIVSPFIGGYLQEWFGWQSTMYFLSIYALVMLVIFLFIPETHHNRTALNVKNIANNFKMVLVHKIFIASVICLAFVYGIILFFNIIGPFLIEKGLGYSPSTYGWIALILGIAWLAGNLTNRFAITRLTTNQIITSSLLFAFVFAIVMAAIAISGVFNIYALVIPTFFIYIGGAFIFPNMYACCLKLFPHISGTAGSLMGSFLVIGAALLSMIATALQSHNQVDLSIANIVILIVIAIAYFSVMFTKNKG